ncbi:MAG TPA: monovalent cation/H+ antiporter subunit D family protein [Longimicrobiaceae bacterium]|nr:monovalent cation/H+ antiporter subunit D family protein [Longimicrobiaceae bacterium]
MIASLIPEFVTQHAPVLQVVIPLMGAALCSMLWRPRLAWGFALLVAWVTFLIAVALLYNVLQTGPISYEIGGWAAPLGIEYRVDALGAFVIFLVASMAAVVTPYARDSVEQELEPNRISLFYTLYLLFIAGMLGILVTGDVFNLFVFLEISSLSVYVLISMGRDRRALTSAFSYLVMGSIGATFIVIGIGLMYAMTGTLNMADLAMRLPAVMDTRTIPVALAFITVGISLKLALFPLHLWLPNAYTFAPSAVSAIVASTSSKVAVYMFLRFFFTIFGVGFAFDVMGLQYVLMPLALIAALATSLVAIFETNVKRLLAYSSLAQIGYIVLGISFGTELGVTAAILHVFNHGLMKGALFLAVGCLVYRIGSVDLHHIRGIGRRMPLTMAAVVAGGLSLIGMPLTVGFISKWYLLLAAVDRGWWPIVIVLLATSLMAMIYIWRIVEAAYFQPLPDEHADVREAPLTLLIPTWILVTANFYFGIDSSFTTDIARRAAESLLGMLP